MENTKIIIMENGNCEYVVCNNCNIKMNETKDKFIRIEMRYDDREIQFPWTVCQTCYNKLFKINPDMKSKELKTLWILIERIIEHIKYIEKLESDLLLLHTKINSFYKADTELREYIDKKFMEIEGKINE